MRNAIALLALLAAPLRAQVTPVMPSRSLTGQAVSPSTVSASNCLRSDSAGTHFLAGPGCGAAEAVFNEASGDVDLRVESNGNANALFVDAGADAVGIMTSAPAAGAAFTSSGSAVFQSTSATVTHFVLKVNNASATELLRVEQQGRIGVGSTAPAYTLDVAGGVRATGQAIVDGSATVKGAGAVRGVLQVGDTGVADAVIHSGDNLTIQIDSNNDGTSNNLQVRRNAATAGGGTLMLNVNENGRMLLGSNDAVTSAQLHVRSDQSPGGSNYVLHISSQDNAGFLTIDQLGNVGYRDTTPDAGLEIVSAVAPTGYVLAVSSQSDVVGGILAVLGDGTIGIGTASPATKLHCSSCTLTIDGNVTASVSVNGTIASSRATDLGWSVVNAANQACNTTCTNACVFGMDTAALGNFLACDNAGSDTCICAGAN